MYIYKGYALSLLYVYVLGVGAMGLQIPLSMCISFSKTPIFKLTDPQVIKPQWFAD